MLLAISYLSPSRSIAALSTAPWFPVSLTKKCRDCSVKCHVVCDNSQYRPTSVTCHASPGVMRTANQTRASYEGSRRFHNHREVLNSVLNVKALVFSTFNQETALLVGASSVIMNLQMDLIQALVRSPYLIYTVLSPRCATRPRP